MAIIDEFLGKLVEKGGSDLHMTTGNRPFVRINGDLIPLEGGPVLTAEDMKQLLFEIMPKANEDDFKQNGDTDFAYVHPTEGRFRTNIFMDMNGMAAVFRVIPTKIPTLEDLNLPDSVKEFCHLSKGLVLVTGPTGSGKSTTLAAMIDYINTHRKDHIITIEDPIEFVFKQKNCLINQREVRRHTRSFKRALRGALREDPDVVLIGEMRDLETVEIALETAETGHLVLGTLHTTTAASTVDRVIDQFPADRQAQIRTMLSTTLKGVISQTLCKSSTLGRVAAHEILITNPAISGQIRDGKTYQIPNVMQSGANEGMVILNHSLVEHIKEKTIEPTEAYIKSVDKSDLKTRLQSAGLLSALHQIKFMSAHKEQELESLTAKR